MKDAAKSYSEIAIIYYFTSKYDSSILYNEKAEELLKISGDTNQLANTVFNKAGVYNTQKKFIESIKCYYKAQFYSRALHDSGGVADCYRNIAKVYVDLKQYNNALECLKEHLKISQRIKSFGRVSGSYLDFATTFEKLNKPLEAIKYYRLHIDLKDSLIENDEKNKLLELEAKRSFNNVVQKNKIRELEQNQKDIVTQQQLQQQKLIRNTFIVGSILLVLLIVLLINRNQLKSKIEMEKMRNRLSRDLHDDIGSTLSSINILSRTAQTNLHHTGDEKAKLSLEKINERSQRLLDNMSDIIWNINPGNDTIEEVMSRMREYATTILEAKNIDYVFNFPVEKMECRLNMEVKNNMYLIFKEAVNNLSKYSQCTVAKLSLTFYEKNIHMKIDDNGKGFDDDGIKHRGGLNNMQHRAEEIKGTIKIDSVIEKGTIIELTMPRYC
ncbi:MAG: tetratricopeptide repeat protein [Bacteroidia bacterium]